METLVTFAVVVLITLFFVKRYLKKLARFEPAEVAAGASSLGGTSGPKPLINASLCIGCGSCVEACPETGALGLVNGKSILVRPERCVVHAKCAEVCPTQAIALSAGPVRQKSRVPQVNENFETNIPGVFVVGELGGVGLIKSSINEGKLVIDHLWRQSQSHEGLSAKDVYDVVIAGTGPAGLSASLTAHEYGLRYLTLEQGEIAATIRHYPRQKLVFAEPLEMPLYGNLHISDTSKESLLAAWENVIGNTGVRIQTGTRVDGVKRHGDYLRVTTSRGEYLSRAVVLAIGRRGSPRQLGVPGEDLGKVAYRLIEAESYRGEDILVVGGGDSALECALALSKGRRNRVTLCYRGEWFHRPKQRNEAQLTKAREEGRIGVLMKSAVVEIRPTSVVLNRDGEGTELPNSYVFVLIGGESPEGLLRKIGIEIVDKTLGGPQTVREHPLAEMPNDCNRWSAS